MVGNWVPRGGDAVRLQAELTAALQGLQTAADKLVLLKSTMSQMAPSTDTSTIATYLLNDVSRTVDAQSLKDVAGSASDILQGATVQALLQRFN